MKNKTRSRRSGTAENTAAVAEGIEENIGLSIPRRSLELGSPQTSLYRILHKDLGLEAYKVQLTQELKPVDNQQRRVFDAGKVFGSCYLSKWWLQLATEIL